MNRRELETNLQDLFDGCIEGEAFDALQEELRANPVARLAYRESLHLQHALQFRAKGVDLLRVVPMDKIVARRQWRTMKQAGLAAAALLLLTSLVMALVLSQPNEATLSFTSSPGTDLMVSHRIDGENLPEGQTLEPGSRLILNRGTVELEFASGVRGILQGPADMVLLREDLLELAQGTVWFDVPRKAIGFQVRTPDLVLTDLGTEFGVLSKPSSLSEVHVFTGEVLVINSQGTKEQEIIKAGHARVAELTGQWEETELNRDHFLTELPDHTSSRITLNDSETFTSSPKNEMIRVDRHAFSSNVALSGFNPGNSDKLVVTFSYEMSYGDSGITEVTYGGVRMSLGARSNQSNKRYTEIYYLDFPGPAGDLVVSFNGSANGIGGSLLALSNTAIGKPAIIAQSGARSVRLTTKVKNSFVVASHISNDQNPDSIITAKKPLAPLFGAPVGSATGGSGYIPVFSRKTITPAFSGNGAEPITIAVAFDPHP